MKINKGKQQKPRRVMLYGPHGVGKSSWAGGWTDTATGVMTPGAPDAIFLNIEDGLSDIDCESTDRIESWEQLEAAIKWLSTEEHSYQWIVIDTADWVERLIHREVCRVKQVQAIGDIDFQRGYQQALNYWDKLLSWLEYLRQAKGMGAIFLAHCEIKNFNDPESKSYDRYQPAMHKDASALIQEWCDEVLFASYRSYVTTEEQGFGKERGIAVGTGERYLRTTESPAMKAKNRLGLPSELEFDWASYARYFQGA